MIFYFSLLIWGKKHKWQPEIRNLQPSSRYVQNVYLCEWHWIYGEDLNKTKDIWTNKSAAMHIYVPVLISFCCTFMKIIIKCIKC